MFDLDNTLYPASSGLFPLVQARMNEYIARLLGVSLDEAKAVRAQYFREHGTTMHGLMAVHRIDPHEFMAFVHDVDLSCVPANPALVAALRGAVRPQAHLHQRLGAACREPAQASWDKPLFQRHFRHRRVGVPPKPAMAPLRLFVDRFGVGRQAR